MWFDEASLRANGVSEEDIARLKQMQGGGASGGEGYDYERHYAYFRMLEYLLHLVNDPTGSDGRVGIQGLSFVDDVIRERDGEAIYSQLKTSPDETWTRDDARLTGDFRQQRLLSRRIAERFRLELVVPDNQRARLLRLKIPRGLGRCTDVVGFPRSGAMQGLLNDGHPVNEIVRQLCALDTRISARQTLFYALHEAWERSSPERSGVRGAQGILRLLKADPEIPIRDPDLQPDARTREALARAAALDDVTILAEDGFVRFLIGLEASPLWRVDDPRFQRFVERMHKSSPTTAEELLELIP